MKLLLSIVLLTFSVNSYAGGWTIWTHVYQNHLTSEPFWDSVDYSYNTSPKGLGISKQINDILTVEVGSYNHSLANIPTYGGENSKGKYGGRAYYAGASLGRDVYVNGDFKIRPNFSMGVADGYPEKDVKLSNSVTDWTYILNRTNSTYLPLVGGNITVSYKNFDLRVLVVYARKPAEEAGYSSMKSKPDLAYQVSLGLFKF